jgi:hypothetical protein
VLTDPATGRFLEPTVESYEPPQDMVPPVTYPSGRSYVRPAEPVPEDLEPPPF